MANYIQKVDDSDLTPFADFNKVLSSGTGSDTGIVIGPISDVSPQTLGFITPSGVPNSSLWEDGGTWTVELEVDAGNSQVKAKVRCVRLDANGIILQSGAFTDIQSMNQDRVFSPVAPNWTDSEEDGKNRLAVEFEFTTPASMIQSATFGLGTIANEVQTDITENVSSIDLFISTEDVFFITLFVNGILDPYRYVERIETWSPTTSGTWETKDLSVPPFNVPVKKVSEIAISNSTSGTGDPAYVGGVRIPGSTIERSIEIHPAESGGKDFVVMSVKSDGPGTIRTFAESLDFNEFTLLGYWNRIGTYLEVSGTLNVTSADTWQGRDLSSLGIPPDSIVEIALNVKERIDNTTVGLRSSGSTLERTFRFHKAEGSGVDSLTLFVNTIGATSNIEIFSSDIADVDFVLLGYVVETPEQEFIETNINIPISSSGDVWETQDLSLLLPLANDVSTLEIVVGNSDEDSEAEIGVREIGSVQDRFLNLHEAESTIQDFTPGLDLARMHTNMRNKSIQVHAGSGSGTAKFHIAGYWQDSPGTGLINSSLDLIVTGHSPIESSIDLFIIGNEIFNSNITLFASGSVGITTINSNTDLVITGHALVESEVDLFTTGKNIISSGLDLVLPDTKDIIDSNTTLFIGSLVIDDSGLDLFIGGKDNFSGNLDLITVGHISVSESLDLFIASKDSIDNNLDLFVKGQALESEQINLFINGHITESGNLDLFIEGHIVDNSGIDLFVKGKDTISPGLDLFIDGHISITDELNLFIASKDIHSSGIDLLIFGKDNVADDIILFVGSKDTQDTGLNLFLIGHQDINDNITLTIIGHTLLSSGVDLFILGNDLISSALNLFVGGFTVEESGIDLVITGHESSAGDLDLFIVGNQIFNDNTTLFISGAIEITTINSSGDLIVTGHTPIQSGLDLVLPSLDVAILGLDLVIIGSGIIPLSGLLLPLCINGVVGRTDDPANPICPILDPDASIQIGSDIIDIFQSRIDALINQLGKNILLEFAKIKVQCPNCLFDTMRNRSRGIYRTGGPRPFARGRRCPWCKGNGFEETSSEKCIKALLKWGTEDVANYGISLSDHKGIVRIKTFLTEFDDLQRAETIVVNYDIQSITRLRVKLIRGPTPVGLREDRYCVSFWELIDD